MKIRHFSLNSKPDSGGSSRYACELSNQEKLLGLDSEIIAFSDRGNIISRILKLIELKRERVDVINIHYSGSFGIFGIRLLLFKLYGVRIISTFHGPWHLEARSSGKSSLRVLAAFLTQQSVCRMSDCLIVMSNAFAEQAKSYTCKNIFIQPPGIDLEIKHKNHSVTKFTRDQKIVCIVRRLVPRMGIDIAIKTMKLLPENYLLRIVGEGFERINLEKLSISLGLSQRITFLGHLSDEELKAVLQESDLMLVPSRELEGYGLVVLEAYQNCLPVIATSVGGLVESVPKEFHEWALCHEISDISLANKVLNFKKELVPSHSKFQKVLQRNDWKKITKYIIEECYSK